MPALFLAAYRTTATSFDALVRGILAVALVGVVSLLFPLKKASADMPVDLELILAVDVSGSIDRGEAHLQREGYTRALTSADVVNAIKSGPLGKVAMTYVEWAGMGHYNVVVDWQIVNSMESAEKFVSHLDRIPFQNAHRTSLSDAIDRSVRHFAANGFKGTRRIIDISGEGANNYGRLVTEARDDALKKDVIINGLPILTNTKSGTYPTIPDLDLFYRDCVIGGPGAFHVVAHGFDDFARAVRKKLILEIADIQPSRLWLASADTRESPPCDIGEWRWMSIIQGGTSDR